MERYVIRHDAAFQQICPRCYIGANDYDLRLDTRRRKGLRTWCVFTTIMIALQDRYTDNLTAGNRWHIDCFGCNICGTILDSDANLLLRDDGSLTCNNCTYHCSVCNNKIDDLAILTGDQAFCAPCFKCRNCKNKIENLKYARTPKGNICMRCHESLMQKRRRKASAKDRQPEQRTSNSLTIVQHWIDKKLPALLSPVTPELQDTIS